MSIGRQLEEGLKLHRDRLGAAERRERVLDMLARVGIRDPKAAVQAWPHEFSGGMRQRMMLASVMLLEPALLIADEPTTALDAVVQRDVLELMVALTREHRTAVLMISHDLPMVARYTERMVVMQHGRVLEEGATAAILERPAHPHAQAAGCDAAPAAGAGGQPGGAHRRGQESGDRLRRPPAPVLAHRRQARVAWHRPAGAAARGGGGGGRVRLGQDHAGPRHRRAAGAVVRPDPVSRGGGGAPRAGATTGSIARWCSRIRIPRWIRA